MTGRAFVKLFISDYAAVPQPQPALPATLAVASAALVAVHFALSAGAFRWHALGNLIKGCPYQLVDNGTLIMENMRHSHISIDDLWEELRLNGVEDLSKVKSAYKERNGQVSVIKMT